MRIEVVDKEVKRRVVRSNKDGKEYTFYTQEAYLHDGSAYPVRFFVPLSDSASSYPVGWYRLSPSSFFVDHFGNLSLRRRFSLVPDEV